MEPNASSKHLEDEEMANNSVSGDDDGKDDEDTLAAKIERPEALIYLPRAFKPEMLALKQYPSAVAKFEVDKMSLDEDSLWV